MSHEFSTMRGALDEAIVGLDAPKRRLLERLALARRLGAGAPGLPPLLLVGPPGSGKDALLSAAQAVSGLDITRVALEDLPLAAVEERAARALEAAATGALAVATAHHPAELPRALLRRFEVVTLPGYGREEKREIARRALAPRALREVAPLDECVSLTPEAIGRLVLDHSREAGVAGLERCLREVVRRAAARVALEEARSVRIDAEEVGRLLGPAPVEPGTTGEERGPRDAEVGVARGVAWTREGGAMVLVEALRCRAAAGPRPPAPHLVDAVEAALAYIASRADALRVAEDGLRASELSIRATGPEPFAPDSGLDLPAFVALVSLASDRPARGDVALAGAVTLRGAVASTPGAPEKVLAAERAGLRQVIVPQADFAGIQATLPASALAAIEVVPVRHAEDAARHALIDIVIARGIA